MTWSLEGEGNGANVFQLGGGEGSGMSYSDGGIPFGIILEFVELVLVVISARVPAADFRFKRFPLLKEAENDLESVPENPNCRYELAWGRVNARREEWDPRRAQHETEWLLRAGNEEETRVSIS